MKKPLVIITTLLFAAFSTFAQSGDSPDILTEAKKAIAAGNAQWVTAWEKGDPKMVVAIFAEDGKFLSSTGKVIKGHSQLLAMYQIAMAGIGKTVKDMKVTVTTTNVWADDGMVFEAGKYSYSYTDDGKPTVETGRYVTIWKKQNDRSWKLFMDMGVPGN